MRVAAWKANDDFFLNHPTTLLPDFNDWLLKPLVHQWAKRIEGVIKVYEAFIPAVRDIIRKDDDFLVIMASAHGTAGASIKAVKAAYPEKRLGVIWVDAHGDLHSPYTTPSGNMHGMPLSIALQEDNKAERRRDLPQETVELWEKLKATGVDGPAVKATDIVLVAARDLEIQERKLIDEKGITNIPVRLLREEGFHIAVKKALQLLEHCDHIYITFDVDSMDQAVSVGTGTPVIGGLIPAEAKGFLKEVVRDPKVRYLEIVEINPTLDMNGNSMAEVAFEILRDVVHVIENEK